MQSVNLIATWYARVYGSFRINIEINVVRNVSPMQSWTLKICFAMEINNEKTYTRQHRLGCERFLHRIEDNFFFKLLIVWKQTIECILKLLYYFWHSSRNVNSYVTQERWHTPYTLSYIPYNHCKFCHAKIAILIILHFSIYFPRNM